MYLIQHYKRILLLFVSMVLTTITEAQTALQFNSLDSLLAFAEKNSAALKTGQQQNLLAKWTKIAALGNTVNLKSPFTASWTNNTNLPVSYLPAEAFGIGIIAIVVLIILGFIFLRKKTGGE